MYASKLPLTAARPRPSRSSVAPILASSKAPLARERLLGAAAAVVVCSTAFFGAGPGEAQTDVQQQPLIQVLHEDRALTSSYPQRALMRLRTGSVDEVALALHGLVDCQDNLSSVAERVIAIRSGLTPPDAKVSEQMVAHAKAVLSQAVTLSRLDLPPAEADIVQQIISSARLLTILAGDMAVDDLALVSHVVASPAAMQEVAFTF